MNIPGFTLLVLLHVLCGYGMISFLKISHLSFFQKITLSALLGAGLSSFIPMILEFLTIPIEKKSVLLSLILLTLIPVMAGFSNIMVSRKEARFSFRHLKLYDLIIAAVMLHLLFAGAYLCYYNPPVSRDITTGAELLAEYTVKEKQINNSVFLQDLSTTNNHQKPPSVLGLQVIYKLFVQPFGQVWLIIISHGFFFFLFFSLKKEVHSVFAGIFTILAIAVPEMYSYTSIILYDFPNTVFVFLALYFLYRYLNDPGRKKNNLVLGSLLFALAVFFRAETLILAIFLCPVFLLWDFFNTKKIHLKSWAINCIYFTLFPFLTYYLSIEVFVKKVLPTGLDTAGSITKNLMNFYPLFERMKDMVSKFMFNFHEQTISYSTRILYAETFNIFIFFAGVELIFIIYKRKISRQTAYWGGLVFLVFFFIAFVGYLLPLADLLNTSKRALFKLVPLIFFFVSGTTVIQHLSGVLTGWETGIKARVPKMAHKKSVQTRKAK